MHRGLRPWSTSNAHSSWKLLPSRTHRRIAAPRPADDTPWQAAGTWAMVTVQDVPALGTCKKTRAWSFGGVDGQGLSSRPQGHSSGSSSALATQSATATTSHRIVVR